MTTTIRRGCAIFAAALAATVLATPAASAFTIGTGEFAQPGLAVDAAGTAYIAWNGPEPTNSALHFCRLPRSATACDAAPAPTLPSPAMTTGASRPFIVVSGDTVTVVQARYPTGGTSPRALYRYISANRGVSFAAPQVVGSVAFVEAAVGPANTLTGVSSNNGTMPVQNVALSGAAPVNPDGSSAVLKADLSTTHIGEASVGLIDAATPLVVLDDLSGNAEFRRYDGSGSLNDVANWTAPVGIGVGSYPKLAGGPNGLFLLAGDASSVLFARKWNGSDFGPPVTLGPGGSPDKHIFEDAAGRIHAVYPTGDASGRHLTHAVSDDGTTWRKGTVATETNPTFGFSALRVATAPDHIGVVVWIGGQYEVRVAAVGPDAPASTVTPPPPPPPPPPPVAPPPPPPVAPKPVVKPKPTVTASGSARRAGGRFHISVTGKLKLPTGVAKAAACTGRIKVTVTRAGKPVAVKTVSVKTSCGFAFGATVARSKVKSAKKLAIRLHFGGNSALAAVTKTGSIKVRR